MGAEAGMIAELFAPGGSLHGRFTPRSHTRVDHLGARVIATPNGGTGEVAVRLLSVGVDDRVRAQLARLAALEHPKVIALHGWGEHRGVAWLLADRVRGTRLTDMLRDDGAPLALGELVPVLAQVLMAVGRAHERGIVIGPVLAHDVLVGARGGRSLAIKLVDFGLAGLVGVRPDGRARPPEGDREAFTTDVFELGVLVLQLLTADIAGAGDRRSAMALSAARPDVPTGLLGLVEDMLAESPVRRPADANAVVERLIDAVPKALFRLPSARADDWSTDGRAASWSHGSGSFAAMPVPIHDEVTPTTPTYGGPQPAATPAPAIAPAPPVDATPSVPMIQAELHTRSSRRWIAVPIVVVLAAAGVVGALHLTARVRDGDGTASAAVIADTGIAVGQAPILDRVPMASPIRAPVVVAPPPSVPMPAPVEVQAAEPQDQPAPELPVPAGPGRRRPHSRAKKPEPVASAVAPASGTSAPPPEPSTPPAAARPERPSEAALLDGRDDRRRRSNELLSGD